ncbi:glycosyltransferase [Tautonia rosea]|uniref:glycosyltransferase n=1 Tax=Tautonia rosea TaxID=2728037 RepID=UPI00147413C7|nr:glycosyltransferase family 2 protein [Tautonia rosea]
MTIATLEGPQCPTPPTLAIVIVNFNSWPDCERLVEAMASSLERIDGRCELILVDNASETPPPSHFENRSGIQIILCPDNAGFAAGVNTAWRRTTARWLLLLNPDTFADADFPEKILHRIAFYEARTEGPPGLVGFALSNEDGTRQHSVGSFPTLAGCLREVWTPRSRRKYWSLGRTRPGPVPWVTGACLLVQASVMEQIGGMDEDFFLYHEEVALCRLARDRGWTVEFDDSITLGHLRPLQSRRVNPVLRVVTRHSKLLYFLKFRPRWEARILAWVITFEAHVRHAWCRWIGQTEDANAWRAVGSIARTLGSDRGLRGIEVRRFAEQSVRDTAPGCRMGSRRRLKGSRGDRPIRLDARKRSR